MTHRLYRAEVPSTGRGFNEQESTSVLIHHDHQNSLALDSWGSDIPSLLPDHYSSQAQSALASRFANPIRFVDGSGDFSCS